MTPRRDRRSTAPSRPRIRSATTPSGDGSGAYTAAFAQWNTDGLANNAYVRLSYEPLEAAKVVPAVSQYLSIVKKYGGLTSQLGEQATLSFLLWATEAKACGDTLTRQCMINHLAKVTSWTGGGLNASGNPSRPPAGLRCPHEAGRDEVDPGLPEEAWDVRLLPEVRRGQHGIGHRHPLELPGLRDPVRDLHCPEASG